MDQSKKEFLPVLEGVKLIKTQSPTTTEDRKRMKVIPYASAIGSIKYAMLCTRSIVYPTLILEREYNIDVTPSMRLYLPRVEARLRGITALKAMSQVR